MAKIALFGASGYLGRAVADQLRASEHEVTALRTPRLRYFPEDLAHQPERLFSSAAVDDVGVEVLGHDIVVNAAGLASAAGRQLDELYGANAAWPLLAALACERAGVPRLIHVSSTAVQGLASIIDDTDIYSPEDSYGASRVRGEQLLGAFRARASSTETTPAADVGPWLTVYRVPSVYGRGRRPSYPLASRQRTAGRDGPRLRLPRPLVVVGAGDQPVAAANVDAVARAVARLAETPRPPALVTHPAEHHTVRSLYRTYEPGRRVLSVPDGPVRAGLRLLGRLPDEPRVLTARRRITLALSGQTQVQSWLDGPSQHPREAPSS